MLHVIQPKYVCTAIVPEVQVGQTHQHLQNLPIGGNKPVLIHWDATVWVNALTLNPSSPGGPFGPL